MKPVKYQLKNGLKVILAQSRKSPVVSAQVWVRTGSADEKKPEAGISHFIEHLVFKGTRKFGVGEVASYIEGAGGELNAYTSFDQTVFHVTIASSQSEVALTSLSEMMGYPLFKSDEIDREREVVIEEIKRGQDSPSRCSSQLMFSTAFKKHPYGRPVIGYDKVIREVSPRVLKKYFQERYCPANMFLIVTGDFENKEMRNQIEQHFGGISKNKIRAVKRAVEPKQTRARIELQKMSFQETQLSLSWKIPSVLHPDVPALDVLALILGQGDSSRLVKRLRIDHATVQSVGSSSFTPLNEGLFAIQMNLEPQNLEEALKIIAYEIQDLQASGPLQEELEKAKICLASEQIYSLETVDGLSRSFGTLEFYLKDPAAFGVYLKRLKALKSSDIAKVARKYIHAKTFTATGISPVETDEMSVRLKKWIGDFKQPKKSPPRKEKKLTPAKLPAGMKSKPPGEMKKIKLRGGGLFLFQQISETPTTCVRVAFGGGVQAEPAPLEGLSELFSRAWAAGSKEYDEHRINSLIDGIAGGFGTFAGRNSVGLSLDYISTFESKVWPVLSDLLSKPELPQDVLDREREILIHQNKLRQDHPSTVCMRAFMRGLFKGHPYAREIGGTEESLALIQKADLDAYMKKVFLRGNFNIAVVGDASFAKWEDRIRALDESFSPGASLIQTHGHQKPVEEMRFFHHLKKEQTHLILGYNGFALNDPRRWTLMVIQAILAGQGGRLFLELRDKNSLAYSVSPLRMEGLGAGYFGAYIACSPDKVGIAEKMIRHEFKRLIEEKVPEAEIERARRYLSGRNAIDLQRKSAVVGSILFDEIYGIDSKQGLRPEPFYEAVTAEKIMEVAKDLFTQPSIVSIVGPHE